MKRLYPNEKDKGHIEIYSAPGITSDMSLLHHVTSCGFCRCLLPRSFGPTGGGMPCDEECSSLHLQSAVNLRHPLKSSRKFRSSTQLAEKCWANVVTYVGATSANDVGPTWICPSVQRWHNVATPPTMTLCQRFANVITYCIVIFDGWYYVCILFIPVNMP